MNWYKYYLQQAEDLSMPDVFDHKDLYISLCVGLAKAETGTFSKLTDLTRAYLEYDEGVKRASLFYNESQMRSMW